MSTLMKAKWMMMTLLWLMAVQSGMSQTHRTMTDIRYTTKQDAYAQQRLTLDVYYDEGKSDCPPLVQTCGDRELELYGRYDENQYLARMMKLVGHQNTYLYEIGGHDHGSLVGPSFHILERHLKALLEGR